MYEKLLVKFLFVYRMTLNRTPLQLLRRPNSCFLCSKTKTNLEASILDEKGISEKDAPKHKKESTGGQKHLRKIRKFFEENPNIRHYKKFIPSKILKNRAYKRPNYLYLICPDIAETVANHVLQRLQGKNQIIAETNPGLGLITEVLRQKGFRSVRLYEANTEFQEYLQGAFKEDVLFYKKDFFNIYKLAYIDNMDQGRRALSLLEGVPTKSWTDDPIMTVIGTINNHTFLKYLVNCIVLQKDVAIYGRIDLFLLTYEKLWQIFTADQDSTQADTHWTVLIRLFFEAELIEKYPRKFFLPWETSGEKKTNRSSKLDNDHMYFIRVTMRKNFMLHADEFVTFYCFMTVLYRRGLARVIPTCEKWVPGSGENLILPKLAPADYFHTMDIFTTFRELTSKQVVAVYRELANHPNFHDSPFMDMVEQEWLKSETIETVLHDSHKKNPV